MSKKQQHFVPKAYIKSWETSVESFNEPQKTFTGVYIFENSYVGNGRNKDSILWKPNLYTIRFTDKCICNSCPKIKSYFVKKVYEELRINSSKPKYAKYKYSIIKTKNSIYKHFDSIDNWEYFYDNGSIAPQSIRNKLNEINCYILEDSFDDYFEKKWETIYKDFIREVHNGTPVAIGDSLREISYETAINMITSFFLMLCRNPSFDAMGLYTKIKNNVLTQIFSEPSKNNDDFDINKIECIDELIKALWYTDLYKIFYKSKEGFYHMMVHHVLEDCQMILYETYENAGSFISSDNPAFSYISNVEKNNINGFYFPISPNYLLFIALGSGKINHVDHRFVDRLTLKHLNTIIKLHSNEIVFSNEKYLSNLIQ